MEGGGGADHIHDTIDWFQYVHLMTMSYMYCTHSSMVELSYTLLQGEVTLLGWNISFQLLILMWMLHSVTFSSQLF